MKQGVPKDFLWGVSTAAAQVEGGYQEGGRTPSIWDIAPKEKIKHGQDCHTACDHFHHFKEDVALMREIGVKSYRFSVSWSRVVPKEGKINEEGLAFYSNLVNELVTAKIEPLVTLYHWDLPVWMHEKGGWETAEIIEQFLFYAKAVVESLSDRVKYWITFNEPQCFLTNGYMVGMHAPFKNDYLKLSGFSRNFMITHGETVKLIRKYAKQKPRIGIAFASGAFIPKDESNPESIEEARKKSFYGGMGTLNNRWWMDPILAGKPVWAYGIYHSRKQDMKQIHQPLDFAGINVYTAYNYTGWGKDKKKDLSQYRKTYLDWVIDGRVMYWTAKFVYERYGIPIMVTENGMANDDKLDINGEVNDQIRIDYMDEYLLALKKAMEEGVPVIGYQHWSLMDNFEWTEGYDPRFGLIYVDFSSGKRILKKSAYHYKHIIETNGELD